MTDLLISEDKSALTLETTPKIDLPDIVRRYSEGESVQVLAQESSVSRQTIYHWMLSELGDNYPDSVTKMLIRRVADADEKLENSASPVDIARAREMARFARMDLERRRPKLYGQKSEMAVDKRVTVVIDRLSGRQPKIVNE